MAADISRGWKIDEKGFLVSSAPAERHGSDTQVWGNLHVPGALEEWDVGELVDLCHATPSVCYRTLEGAKAGALRGIDSDWEDMREYWEETPDAPGHDGTLHWEDPYGTGKFLRAETFTGGTVWVYMMELIYGHE
jgi:hypothetical protein